MLTIKIKEQEQDMSNSITLADEHKDEMFFGDLLEFIVANREHVPTDTAAFIDKNHKALQQLIRESQNGVPDPGKAAEIHAILSIKGAKMADGLQAIIQAHSEGKPVVHAEHFGKDGNSLLLPSDPADTSAWWADATRPPVTAPVSAAPAQTDFAEMIKNTIGQDIGQGATELASIFGEILKPIGGILGTAKDVFDGLPPIIKASGVGLLGAMLVIPLLSQIPLIGKPLSGFFSSLMPLAGIALLVAVVGNMLSSEKGVLTGTYQAQGETAADTYRGSEVPAGEVPSRPSRGGPDVVVG